MRLIGAFLLISGLSLTSCNNFFYPPLNRYPNFGPPLGWRTGATLPPGSQNDNAQKGQDNEDAVETAKETPYCVPQYFAGPLPDQPLENYRKHRDGSCHVLGTEGPCGPSMTFQQNPLSGYEDMGICDCNPYLIRLHVYIPKLDACFPVFSRGPCALGHWVTLNETTKLPQCSFNPCSKYQLGQYKDDPLEFQYYVFYQRNAETDMKLCYRTFSRGYCEKGLVLKPNRKLYPECSPKEQSGSYLPGNIRREECRPGSKLDRLLSKCAMPNKHSVG